MNYLRLSKIRLLPSTKMKRRKFKWHPPKTISQREAEYRAAHFTRAGARSPLPEDLIKQDRNDDKD